MRSFADAMRGLFSAGPLLFSRRKRDAMTDPYEIENWDHHCIVCHKSVDEGGGMAHFKVEDRMVALCCPLCIETFNKNPKHYLTLRRIAEASRKISHPGERPE